MITQIFVEGQELDINADISSLITFAIDDVKNFATRQTAFSRTVVLPGTGNNNAIFGNIFDTGISNDYDPLLNNIGYNFNAAKSAKCIIFQDNLQTFKGTLRLLKIRKNKGRIEYEAALNGDLTTLNVALSSGYLTDLDFSEHDLQYNVANIAASWDNPPGSGVYFPMIDYGNYSQAKKDWDYHTFRPALYVKEYIDKMFAATSGIYRVISFGVSGGPTVYVDVSINGILDIKIGDSVFTDKALTSAYPDGTYNVAGTDFSFTVLTGVVTATADPAGTGSGTPVKYASANGNFRYECDLFNTARFKKLVVPHNQKVLQSLVSQIMSATDTGGHPLPVVTTPGGFPLTWDSFIAGGFTYSAGRFTYTQATSLTIAIQWNLAGTMTSDSSGSFTIFIRKNGIALASRSFGPGVGTISYHWSSSVSTTLITGDIIDISVMKSSGRGHTTGTINSGSGFNLSSNVPTLQPVDYNQVITLNDAIPKNVRQIDFLTSIVQLFNLYVYESQFDDRLILISPFVDYYTAGSSQVIDWTYKLNRDKDINITPLSEINSKLYYFTYKADSDYYNDLYQKRYNLGYGSYIFDSEFEFADQINTLTLVFAPTPLVGYVGEKKVYPTIFKRTGNVLGQGEENVDSVIRILQTEKITTAVPSWNILSRPNDETSIIGTYTAYGYAGHFDDPYNPGNDLNFGALSELFYLLSNIAGLSNTQFNVYWSAYMAEITNKDSKLLTGNFYLTPKDIFKLDFSQYIAVDGVLFRLNKITDYNATVPSDCEVELLKVINTSYSFPAGSEIRDDYALEWSPGQALEWSPPAMVGDTSVQILYK